MRTNSPARAVVTLFLLYGLSAYSAAQSQDQAAPPEYALLLEDGASILSAEIPDWAAYRNVIHQLMRAPRDLHGVADLARAALTAPRAEKITAEHGRALLETLDLLGRNDTRESAELLKEALTAEFWGAWPLRSEVLRANDQYAAVQFMRVRSLKALTQLDAALALPALEKLATAYPNKEPKSAPTSEWSFDENAGFMIDQAIYDVRERAGLTVGESPTHRYMRSQGIDPDAPAEPDDAAP